MTVCLKYGGSAICFWLVCFAHVFFMYCSSFTVHDCSCSVVEYASREDMKVAIRKLDGTELNGRRLRLIEERVSSSNYRRYA